MKYNLNINNRAFSAIINKTKRIEIRAYTGNTDYSKMVCGDLIVFKNENNEKIVCRIIEINHYSSIEELLTLEGTRYTTSSTNDFKKAVENINKLNG